MGALTVTNVLTRVQRSFGDEAGVQIAEADIIRWINDAQREAAMQHENLLQAIDYIDSVANTGVYTLATNCINVTSVYYRESSTSSVSYYALRYLSAPEFNEFIDGWSGPDYGSGLPQVFTRGDTEGNITVFPYPDAAYTDGFKVVYSRYPVDIVTNADAIDLPQYYHNYVVEYCMMKAYEMDEDWDASNRKAQYASGVLDFNNNRQSWFGRETYPTITSRWEDFL